MKPLTVTLYMFVDDDERPDQWDMGSWLNTDELVGWDITEGHGDCAACADNTHEEAS
jgi:hypothetical protein